VPFENQHEEMVAELERARRLVEELRTQTGQATFKATPKNKMFTVTVGGQGELRTLAFRGDAYRSLPPTELAQLIVDTVERARKASVAEAVAEIEKIVPEAAMPLDLLSPGSTIEELMNNMLGVAERYLPTPDVDSLRTKEHS
jgi:DNA-binding protein YbaB